MSLLVFQGHDFEDTASKFQEDFIVTVTGKVKANNDEISIMVQGVNVIDYSQGAKSVYIDLDGFDQLSVVKDIKLVSRQFKGSLPLYFRLGDVTILAHKKYWVSDDPLCRSQLENLVGSGRLWMA